MQSGGKFSANETTDCALRDPGHSSSRFAEYGEGGLGARPHVRNFTFLDRPDHIKLVTEINGAPVPVPFVPPDAPTEPA